MKNKHKHIASITRLFVLFSFLFSCISTHKGDSHQPVEARNYDGFTKATVINYTVDGCSWMLQLEDGKKLQPDLLKSEFQKDNLNVWIKYSIKKGGVGICMAGEIVDITEIELRK